MTDRPHPSSQAERAADLRAARSKRGWRALQLTCMVLSVSSLMGYLAMTTQVAEGARAQLIVAPGEAPSFSVLLAGLDVAYCYYHTPCKPGDPRIQSLSRTDTLMLAIFDKTHVKILSIPRDTWVDGTNRKVNAGYPIGGPEQMVHDVETVTGQRIDYYAVVKLSYVEDIIDALGGLDVNAPAPVDFVDNAAKLRLKLDAGPHHLNGKDAVAFLRMRKAPGWGDDYGRMDRQKEAVAQLLDKLRSPQGLSALPSLMAAFSQGVTTNADPGLLQQMVPHLGSYRLQMATLPTHDGQGSYLIADRSRLADVLGKDIPENTVSQPTVPARILDASGQPGLGEALARYLRLRGLEVGQIEVQPKSLERSRVVTLNEVTSAQAYADFLGLARLQALRFPVSYGEVVIYLGADAAERFGGLAAFAGH
ncbi:LCP family protein required for cell wall assembly [Deinobacterium chartae]|uniref:LCP family protein required for cell wall assembly n=1 Tax=Deinobacterium chartae TaxID=521158 RepID=A0A841I347_9DEIO|nr:LCP family protein [Deinobacterium chartae]MBB6098840.1 LCP family protein required for cell wall assembly [Deinobacterium chartae]